jgi:ankyrin repeat protein
MLLQKGTDLNIRDARGKSAFDHAVIQENEQMVELIQKYWQVSS